MEKEKNVLIVCQSLRHYRVPFFKQLKEELSLKGIKLNLVYGDGDLTDRRRGGMVSIEWGHPIKNFVFKILGIELLWQPIFKFLKGNQLVIVMQVNKLLVNYLLLPSQFLGGPKVAFWGHGRNLRASPKHNPREQLKALYSRTAFWWFAYNEKSKEIVRSLGFPEERITDVQNTIETEDLTRDCHKISSSEKNEILKKYGLRGTSTCLYSGSLYKEKGLTFLFEACGLIAQEVKEFELVIMGDGEERELVKEASQKYPWLHFIGSQYSFEKARVMSTSKLLLVPGIVGLVIVDSFATGVPLITTISDHHGPEIGYLENWKNGVMTNCSVQEYAETVIRLLKNDQLYSDLRQGALQARERYTMANMVKRFSDGVEKALSLIGN